jgi:hypothetical protein
MSIQQTLHQEIEESKRWCEVEKMIQRTKEIFKKGLNR